MIFFDNRRDERQFVCRRFELSPQECGTGITDMLCSVFFKLDARRLLVFAVLGCDDSEAGDDDFNADHVADFDFLRPHFPFRDGLYAQPFGFQLWTNKFPTYRTRPEHHNSHSAQVHCYSNSSLGNRSSHCYSNSCRGAVRHTSQESRRLRRTLSHHIESSIRAPAGRGFSALVFFARVAGHALRVRSATMDYIARFRNGSDAPRAPQFALSTSAPALQSEPREPQPAP